MQWVGEPEERCNKLQMSRFILHNPLGLPLWIQIINCHKMSLEIFWSSYKHKKNPSLSLKLS